MIVTPLELFRTKKQSEKLSYRQLGQAVRVSVKQGGPLSVYRGLSATLLRDVPFSGRYTSDWTWSLLIVRSKHENIYIIISKNIRYLLWNQGFCRSLNNTHPIFPTPCIRCTNHFCGSCDLTDVNPHFIPSQLRKIQNVDLLWRHRY